MNIQESPYWTFLEQNWDFIKVLSEPNNFNSVEEIIDTIKYNGNMPLAKRYKVLGSSADPEKVSRTLKSIAGFVVSIAAFRGIDIPQTEIDLYITAALSIYTGGSTVYYGVLRAIAWAKNKGWLK